MTISENGVMTTDSDDIDILILTPLKEYLMDQSGGGDNLSLIHILMLKLLIKSFLLVVPG